MLSLQFARHIPDVLQEVVKQCAAMIGIWSDENLGNTFDEEDFTDSQSHNIGLCPCEAARSIPCPFIAAREFLGFSS